MGIDDSTIQLFNFYRTYAYTLKSITLLQPLMALVLNVGNYPKILPKTCKEKENSNLINLDIH